MAAFQLTSLFVSPNCQVLILISFVFIYETEDGAFERMDRLSLTVPPV